MQKFTGYEYIKIDVANHFGLDKELYETRINWVNKNHKKLENLMNQADEPFLYIAAVHALRDAEAHIPTGHMVGFDACASGMQILSVLSGCKLTAELTGLVNPNERADAYTKIALAINKKLPSDQQIIFGDSDTAITRKDVKQAVMTYFYGSEQEPKNAFQENSLTYNTFFEILRELAPGAEQLRDLFIGIWPAGNKINIWTLPDGFSARVRVMVDKETKIEVDELGGATFTHYYSVNEGTKKGVSLAANITHSVDGYLVREIGRRCDYDNGKLVKTLRLLNEYLKYEPFVAYINDHPLSLVAVDYLSENTIDRFDKGMLFALKAMIERTLNRSRPFQMISVHDEFKCPPNNMGTLREVYLEILQEIAESNLAQAIMREITGKSTAIYKKFSNDLSKTMTDANYHIC